MRLIGWVARMGDGYSRPTLTVLLLSSTNDTLKNQYITMDQNESFSSCLIEKEDKYGQSGWAEFAYKASFISSSVQRLIFLIYR